VVLGTGGVVVHFTGDQSMQPQATSTLMTAPAATKPATASAHRVNWRFRVGGTQ